MLSSYEDPEALAAVEAPCPAKPQVPLVQIEASTSAQIESQIEREAAPQGSR
jgi:hypothetical protein